MISNSLHNRRLPHGNKGKKYICKIYVKVYKIYFSKSCTFKLYFTYILYIYIWQNISDIYLKYTWHIFKWRKKIYIRGKICRIYISFPWGLKSRLTWFHVISYDGIFDFERSCSMISLVNGPSILKSLMVNFFSDFCYIAKYWIKLLFKSVCVKHP